MKFQNRSKQSSRHYHFFWLFFFVHKKELHIFIARNSISANKKIGNSELFGCSFLYYKKNDPEAVTELRKLHNPKKNFGSFFFINFYAKDMYIPDYIQ